MKPKTNDRSSKVRTIVVLLLSLTSCLSAGQRPSQTLDNPGAPPPNFIGCRLDAGQCKNSCPQRDGHGDVMPQFCKSQQEPFACFCGYLEAPLPEPPAQNFIFAGCRFHPHDCAHTCPGAIGMPSKSRCPDPAPEGPLACFCPR
jgi:hypothetical protein